MITLNTVADINTLIKENRFSLIYFTTPGCGVCTALYPKLEKILKSYPQLKAAKVSLDEVTEAAGAFSIFTIPCILAYMDSKEIIREARFISVDLLEDRIARYYAYMD